jgi:hypothetical protein
MANIDAAAQFVHAHARLIDRRRLDHLTGAGSAEEVLAALAAYRNPDGGLGMLEPDFRSPASQPGCCIYAFEILHETEAADLSLATGALDWLETIAHDDGGVPFVLPSARGWPHAPFFQLDDDPGSSLLMTAAVAGGAHRLGLDHPWLDRATEFCWERAGDATSGGAYDMLFFLRFLDAVPDRERADEAIEALRPRIPADGLVHVHSETEGEVLRPLVLAPRPEHAARRLFDDAVIERELDRLDGEQQADGGWDFSWAHWNPAVVWEWRGAVTIDALHTLRAYGRLG